MADETKETLINLILKIETDMFDHVENIHGRAPCQDHKLTFLQNRKGQFLAWNSTTLKSYSQDLLIAKRNGCNLVSYKYGYMMESTNPIEYRKIAHQLPPVSEEKKQFIEKLVKDHLKQMDDLFHKYPSLSLGSRVPYSTQDSEESTSFETYLRGELKTYSSKTLKSYKTFFDELQIKERNIHEEIIKNTILLSKNLS